MVNPDYSEYVYIIINILEDSKQFSFQEKRARCSTVIHGIQTTYRIFNLYNPLFFVPEL